MEELKNVLLAGIGLTSMTLEKADAFVKELVDKGRISMDEGKELQQELKRKGEVEAQAVINEVKAKAEPYKYATKEDLARLEAKLDRLLSKDDTKD